MPSTTSAAHPPTTRTHLAGRSGLVQVLTTVAPCSPAPSAPNSPTPTRARLLFADVVVDDDGGQGDAAEVGQGVFDAPMDVKRLIEPWVQLWCW